MASVTINKKQYWYSDINGTLFGPEGRVIKLRDKPTTPLRYAIARRDKTAIRHLLRDGALINQRSIKAIKDNKIRNFVKNERKKVLKDKTKGQRSKAA